MIVAHVVAELLLVGTIVGGPVNVAQFRNGDQVYTKKQGEYIDGHFIRRIEANHVVLVSPLEERVVRTHDFVDDYGHLSRGIAINGDTVELSADVHKYITVSGKTRIVMEATATQVQQGFRLWNFDPGSVYDLVGLKNDDIITHIDKTALTTPQVGLEALERVRTANEFTVSLIRKGVAKTLTVKVAR